MCFKINSLWVFKPDLSFYGCKNLNRRYRYRVILKCCTKFPTYIDLGNAFIEKWDILMLFVSYELIECIINFSFEWVSKVADRNVVHIYIFAF